MINQPKILIVDDNMVNRCVLNKILSERYNVMEAQNGSEAILVIKKEKDNICAVLLDLVMPVMGGFEFMATAKELLLLYNIPVIVTTQNDCEQTELEALSLGAADFLVKPYRPQIILKRLENMLRLKENSILRNTMERDKLTGVYNQETFFTKAHELMVKNTARQYAVICMDIEHFKLVNELLGKNEGDRLLKAVAKALSAITNPEISICARISGDVFGLCMPYDKSVDELLSKTVEQFVHRYPINLRLNFKFGVYVVEDVRLPVSSMCDRSKIAIQSIKGKFDRCIALYDDNHRKALIEEQEISSQMHKALENGEFIPYYQPKYNLCTGEIVGAEALVRWIHPTKGIIPPQNFIQLFEKNGFISSVDFHMWECVCKYLNGVIQEGKTPLPVSVNVSRVDVYNPNLCNFLQGLVKKYNISPDLLELEITENSYIENAEELIKTINDLKALGFTIEMDDFGSGYSSLNMLSDVPVDVIKLDMRFLQSKNAFSGQKNILSFIVSLANWMDVQTVAEGIETVEQVEFLRSLGYAKGQGYYFAKPMPQGEYEQLLEKNEVLDVGDNNPIIFSKLLSYNEIWNPVSQFSVIFKGFVASMAIWEVSDGKIKFMRGNDRLLNAAKAYTGSDTYIYSKDVTELICEEERAEFLRLVGETCKANTYAITENRWMCPLKKNLWVNSRISVIFNDGTKAVLMVELTDVTRQKQLEEMAAQANADLQKHSNFFEQIYDSIPCGIAQFDYEKQETHFKNLNLAMVKILGYSSKKEFWEDNCDFIKLMSQETLAEIKHKLKRLEDKPLGTPVMVEYQLVGEKCGTIWVKAYTQLILDVDGRMTNQCVFIDITETRSKMESLNRKASKDPLTGLYNRAVFQTAVTAFIEEAVELTGAFLVLDIDNFKYINDTYGHQKGDEVLKTMSEVLTVTLRTSDIISRMGGDEFAVYLKDLPSEALAINLAKVICDRVAGVIKEKVGVMVTCSIGISIAKSSSDSYEMLYKEADCALYHAKHLGKNQSVVYTEQLKEEIGDEKGL